MKRTHILKALVLGTALPMLYLADVSPDAAPGLTLVREAHAIVGAPMTPLSVAGVARRTTARVVVAETAAVGATAAATNSAAVSQQQAATAQQQAAARPAGAPAIGSVVNTLPAGCVPEAKGGVEYQKCGGVYYRSAFQGNNLVYVVQ